MVGDKRQGYAILAAMGVLWARPGHRRDRARGRTTPAPRSRPPARRWRARRPGSASAASALFAVSTTGTSTGAVNSFHDSFTALGGGLLIFNMMLGEVAPGGVGSGLYGMLVLAIITVFVAGLMVGRTPEYLRQEDHGARDQARLALHPDHAACSCWSAPGIAMAFRRPQGVDAQPRARTGCPRCSTPSRRRPTTTAPRSPGSPRTPTSTTPRSGFAMLLGRFLPIVFVLALAGSLARQQPVPATAGTLPTHRPAVRRRCSSASSSSSPA